MKKAKFRVGDKVYCPKVSHKIFTIIEFYGIDDIFLTVGNSDLTLKLIISPDVTGLQLSDVLYHATPKNHALLEQLYGVKFEAPPKHKTPKKIIQAMLDDGWKCVPCYVANKTDEFGDIYLTTFNAKFIVAVVHDLKAPFDDLIEFWRYAFPFDPKTGKVIIDYVDGKIVTE